ncbi:MAG: type I toxin-antitoxin system SymE family toxin [Lachnospiraceae bacterium]|nr:type I toxin-antitoxin system SymE family toxin [Muribaculaceae bacterium]MCM1411068.1 type I toxin-antitoxin system SymE family toxin [Lachnospiraceae bacterium]
MQKIKEYRNMKVCVQSGYRYKPTPTITLKGQWLKDLGFDIGDLILVKCEGGKIIITPDKVGAELIEAEKAFMEQETRKLRERFLKEKTELRARFVAEKRAEYGVAAEAGLKV